MLALEDCPSNKTKTLIGCLVAIPNQRQVFGGKFMRSRSAQTQSNKWIQPHTGNDPSAKHISNYSFFGQNRYGRKSRRAEWENFDISTFKNSWKLYSNVVSPALDC